MLEAWKEVRVFISSTFNDMQAERDHMVRFIFPRLREELLHRRIHFVDVDLRWGVTADQAAFALALEKHPGEGEGRRVGVGGRHPIIVTAVDLGSGLAIRCPFCNTSKPLKKEWLGIEIKCPQEGCNGPLRVNPFVVTRPSWLEKSQ